VPSTDGVTVASYRLADGLPGVPPVVAAHPTGFCAAVLEPMARHLGPHPVVAFDERGHGRSGRPASGSFAWSGFADDVLAVVDAGGLDRPLGFGHSCGGAALVLAEARRPGTFAGLYLYEPVIPPLDEPLAGGQPDNPLSAGARRRRTHFAGRDDALANFAAKAPFGDLDPVALAAYVDNGFRPDGQGGITLCCARDDEAAVYAAASAHDAFRLLPAVRCPVTIACGERTDAFDERALKPVVERLPQADLQVLPGLGHFGPQQDPAAVARSVLHSAAWAPSPARGTPGP
jgi:pimeloyl-ACP methyl ester carboxylesterase